MALPKKEPGFCKIYTTILGEYNPFFPYLLTSEF